MPAATTKSRKPTARKDEKYFQATGSRKTAVARVRLYEAKHVSYICNDRPLEEYFPTEELRTVVQSAFQYMTLPQLYAVTIVVKGGGMKAQAEAVRHGISRALIVADKDLRAPLKRLKFLTRDDRAKERRKFGLKKARKAPQWSKR